jgi:hypothetical protein
VRRVAVAQDRDQAAQQHVIDDRDPLHAAQPTGERQLRLGKGSQIPSTALKTRQWRVSVE